MFRFLHWLQHTRWFTVWAVSLIGSCTLSLVFAGTVNDIAYKQGAGKRHSTGSLLQHVQKRSSAFPSQDILPETQYGVSTSLTRLSSDHARVSREVYLLLDLSKNLLLVKRGNRTLRTALAATGSGKILQDPEDPSRKWRFETPRGDFTIESKLKNPVWMRPDWAFIEKGDPVPKDAKSRILPNALGDYALGFGDGYFIHGALYTYLLGFDVTHGCIQLNDEDLQYVFETVPIGAKLVII